MRSEEVNYLVNECGKRLIFCEYCEIILLREKMLEYQEFCGLKMEWCYNCS